MKDSERAKFERRLEILFAAYNVPPTPVRKEAYWFALHRSIELESFLAAIDVILADPPAELPNTSQLRAACRPTMPLAEEIKAKADSLQFRAQFPNESNSQYTTQLRLHEMKQDRSNVGEVATRIAWEAEFAQRFGAAQQKEVKR